MVPPGTRRLIADNLPWWLRDKLGAHLQSADIDWARTRAFALPTDLEGCIRINLKGREPQGIVEPGSAYLELCEQIRDELLELTNPATGAPAVRQVHLRHEVFPGERGDHLPDIIVTWNDEAPISGLTSPRVGLVEEASPDPRTGTHSTAGFLLAAGPGSRPEVEARGTCSTWRRRCSSCWVWSRGATRSRAGRFVPWPAANARHRCRRNSWKRK